MLLASCNDNEDSGSDFPDIQVPKGFAVEKVVDGLQLPTSVTWDDQGNMFIVEAGGGLEPEKKAALRIMQIQNGKAK